MDKNAPVKDLLEISTIKQLPLLAQAVLIPLLIALILSFPALGALGYYCGYKILRNQWESEYITESWVPNCDKNLSRDDEGHCVADNREGLILSLLIC